ncbi:MAG: type II toxin-antitoxin system Phd/YefM family antitoxin [Thermodesulfobacteriota bacterium]
METYIPITRAKNKLLDLIRSVHDKDDTIAITKNGVPEAVVMSMARFEGLMETIEILSDPETMTILRKSMDDVAAGRLVKMDEVF